MAASKHVRERQFRAIAHDDLALLFDLYDSRFFSGGLRKLLDRGSLGGPLTFRVSPHLTRAGGKTTRRILRPKVVGLRPIRLYEIAIASDLLFRSFAADDRPITVCGHVCTDRLDAMMRIFEHELVHLDEMLEFEKSSCSGTRFHQIARHVFGHTGFTHDLVLAEETAAKTHGIRRGDRVVFSFDGKTLRGVVNRIQKRATVLVEDPAGLRYSDGKHYHRYYIPLPMLEREA